MGTNKKQKNESPESGATILTAANVDGRRVAFKEDFKLVLARAQALDDQRVVAWVPDTFKPQRFVLIEDVSVLTIVDEEAKDALEQTWHARLSVSVRLTSPGPIASEEDLRNLVAMEILKGFQSPEDLGSLIDRAVLTEECWRGQKVYY